MEDTLKIQEFLENAERLRIEKKYTAWALTLLTLLYLYFIISPNDGIYHLFDSSIIITHKIIQLFCLGIICVCLRNFFPFSKLIFGKILMMGVSFILVCIIVVVQLYYG